VLSTSVGTTTTFFIGAHYEVTGNEITKYYFAGTQRIAMRKNGTLYYLLGDHLGSTSIVTDASGNAISQTKYKAWGEVRYQSGVMPTEYQFTGQASYEPEFGLLFYNARFYDPSLSRFISADSIIPSGVQGLDRYGYVNNSPVNFTDPTGHVPCYGGNYDDGPQCAKEGSPSKWYYDNWKYQEIATVEFFEAMKEDVKDFNAFYEDVFSPASGIDLGKDIIQPNEGLCQVYGAECWGVGELIDGLLTIKEGVDILAETFKESVINAPTSIYTPTHFLQTPTIIKTPSAALAISPMMTPTEYTPPSNFHGPVITETPTPTKSPTLTPFPVTNTYMPTIPYVTPTYFP